jgi:hypothetical protein
VNLKKGIMLPKVLLSGKALENFVEKVLPAILNRAIDKVVILNYKILSNKLVFSFQAADAMPIEMRKI